MSDHESVSKRSLCRFLQEIVTKNRRYIFLAFIFAVVEAFVGTVLFPGVIDGIVETISNSRDEAILILLLIQYFLLEAGNEVVIRVQDFLFDVIITPRIRGRVIEKGIEKVIDKEYVFHASLPKGALAEHITRLSDVIPNVVETLFSKVAYLFCVFVFATYSLSIIDHRLGLLMVLFFILVVATFCFFNKRLTIAAGNLSKGHAQVGGLIIDVLTNVLTVKLFLGKEREKRYMNKAIRENIKREKKVGMTYLLALTLVGIGYIVLQSFSVYFLWDMFVQNKINPGAIVAVLYINNNVVDMIWYDFTDLTLLYGEVGQAQKSLGVLSSFGEEKGGGKDLQVTQGDIEFRNVAFVYPWEKERELLFDNFSLKIKGGQKIGFVGYSGSGKTSLVNLLLRLHEPEKGDIYIDGQGIGGVSLSSLRENIGVLSQNEKLFLRSVRENILYGNSNSTFDEVIAAAKSVQAHDFIADMKDGYDTPICEGQKGMSGGQTQRLGLARLLLKDAPIIILDEATSQIDSLTEREIQKAFGSVLKNKTVIHIAHRLSSLVNVDRIVVIDEGKIVEDGDHETLLKKGGLYASLWETQMQNLPVGVKEDKPKKS